METKKNIEINSNNFMNLRLLDLQKDINTNSLLLKNIDVIEKDKLFEKISIKKWELLFDEWDIDKKLYLIKKWNISIEKYKTHLKDSTKQLTVLSKWNFLWESAIDTNASWVKEVLAKAITNTEVIAISWDKIKEFVKKSPEIWYEMLQYIIIETNKRLLESNKIITSNSEIENTINALEKITQKSIFWVIDKIQDISGVDYILFFERHEALPKYLILKYDSRKPNQMQDIVFEKKWYFIDLDMLFVDCDIKKDDHIVINKLSLWDELFWFLIFWRAKKIFDWSDKKLFNSVWNSLAWVLKKFLSDREIKNIEYLNSKMY